jgi:hypothetical protein
MSDEKMKSVIESVVASQPPVWRIGIMTAQKFLAALVKSEQVPVKAIGSLLLSFFALIKLEGYSSGILELQTNVLKALDENKDASPEKLLEVLRDALEIEHEKLVKNAGALYMTTLSAMIRQTASMPVDATGLDSASDTFNAFTEAALEEHTE